MFDTSPADVPEPAELVGSYQSELRDILDSVPADERPTIETVTISSAAEILERESDRLDASAIEAELLDGLLIEMSNAVVDVETLAAEIDLDRSGKELQQRIEGRAPMTLEEYAHIKYAIVNRN